MKDFKVSQRLYNALTNHDDMIGEGVIHLTNRDEIIKYSIEYFNKNLDYLYYPSKSYSVAIIYSYLLNKKFNEDFFISLNDPDLFCGNDRFFVPYDSAKEIYKEIFEAIGLFRPEFKLNLEINQVRDTVKYFHAEFGLDN